MTNIITIIDTDIQAGWAWVQKEAVDLYNAVSPLVAAPLKAFEQVVVQNLWGAAAAFIANLMPALNAVNLQAGLADLETAFLNTLGHLWPSLLSAAQALGSQLLQIILGSFQAKAAAA